MKTCKALGLDEIATEMIEALSINHTQITKNLTLLRNTYNNLRNYPEMYLFLFFIFFENKKNKKIKANK